MNFSCSRRDLLVRAGALAASATTLPGEAAVQTAEKDADQGRQRLSLDKLRQWEALGYGMFICFGMSTFLGRELPDGKDPASVYAPDRLDVDQWISVARDAGMKYAVLTAKHTAGHCLWPSKHTRHTVAHSTDKTDVCEKFVEACAKRGVKPGLYYCSWDNHHRFGSRTPSDVKRDRTKWPWGQYNFNQIAAEPPSPVEDIPAFTTSIYQGFQTAQITELLTQYGPITEIWIDIPGILGMSYRTFLYQHMAALQPEAAILMNSAFTTGETYDTELAWPADLIAMERRMPPATGHVKWRNVNGKKYYLPGEVCDVIGKKWFFVPGDTPRADQELLQQHQDCRARGANLLLSVPPDKHGLIPDAYIAALTRLRQSAGL